LGKEKLILVGDKLLVIRGSGLAIGYAVRWTIVEEDKKHRELVVNKQSDIWGSTFYNYLGNNSTKSSLIYKSVLYMLKLGLVN
jgi:hypothetical protein